MNVRFLNRRREAYEWTDEVPENDDDFQGLLEEEEAAAQYPDISAELPGVELNSEEGEFQTVLDEPEPYFRDMAAAALHNAGIDGDEIIRRGQARELAAAHAEQRGANLVEADEDELVYEIAFELPDEGLLPMPLGDGRDNTSIPVIALSNDETENEVQEDTAEVRRYLTRACRSAVGNQPYDTYAPRTTFLQLGMVQAHRSALETSRLARMTKQERLLATTISTKLTINNVTHNVDTEMCTESKEEIMVWANLMMQYNLKPGLRKFGTRGVAAAVKELTQLHIMDTWTLVEVGKLSREQRMRALSSLLFLKEKRTGDNKGRACINGAPQRAYIPKEDAASPTVSTESTFITATIAATEKRKVQCYDVPSAFVNTEVDEDVIMVLNGNLADMMIQIAPETYRKYVTVDKRGMKVLYVKQKKALYGLMRASLLFYRKLRKEFEEYGLAVNPYDPCVANMEMKGGKQLAVVWHVDDLMVSCEDDFELTKFSCYLGNIYGTKLSMHMVVNHN
jgi:hypothetical protein